MCSPRSYFILSLSLLLASVVVHADDSQKRQELDALLAKAKVTNLRTERSSGFRLRLEIHAEHISAKPLDGTYDEIWNAPDAWYREIVFPGLKQDELRDKDGRWVDRNLDFEPQLIYLLARLLDSLSLPSPAADEKVTRIYKDKKEGTELKCAELGQGPAHQKLCFDENGLVFSIEYPMLRMEYRDYQKFGQATFPRMLRVYDDGERVLDVRVTELSAVSENATHFPRSPSALQLAACERRVPDPPLKKVPPHYPEKARRERVQGTVVLYALLAPDGSVRKLKVLRSPGPDLDRAATEAVAQWIYRPLDCGGGSNLPTEIEILVNFALSY